MTLGILNGLDLNLVPLGVDRAFDQSSPVHDVDWAYRRATYGGAALDAGFAPGVATWDRAGIPVMPYLFGKPRNYCDPVAQAERLLEGARLVKHTHAVIIDDEYELGGRMSLGDLQAAIDHCDAAGSLVVVYLSDGAWRDGLRHVAAYIIASYDYRPKRGQAWQWTSTRPVPGDSTGYGGIDRDVWIDIPSYNLIFPNAPVKAHIPIPSNPTAKRYPMIDLVPQTLHRVVDLSVGTVFREFPDATASIEGTVSHPDATPAQGQAPGSMAFGYRGKPIGITGWYEVANGDRGVYVRASTVLAVRTQDKNVGV